MKKKHIYYYLNEKYITMVCERTKISLNFLYSTLNFDIECYNAAYLICFVFSTTNATYSLSSINVTS